MPTFVTEKNFPTLFKALHIIDLDNNVINRTDPAIIEYLVSSPNCQGAEFALSTLTEDELELMCAGEETEREEFIKARPWLKSANKILEKYFKEL